MKSPQLEHGRAINRRGARSRQVRLVTGVTTDDEIQNGIDHRRHRSGWRLSFEASCSTRAMRSTACCVEVPQPTSSTRGLKWIGIADKITLHDGNLTDLSESLIRIIAAMSVRHEVYNLAAQSFVKSSWQQPLLTGTVTGLGAVNMLEAVRHRLPGGALLSGVVVRDVRPHPGAGAVGDDALLSALALCGGQALRPLDDRQLPRELRPACLERHSFQSRVARCAASNSSPARSPTAWRASSSGLQDKLALGNLDAKRDWGHARDYVKAMWLMLQQDKPDDYVVATGRTTSVREFCKLAFAPVGLNMDDHVASTSAICGRPRSMSCSAMPAKAKEKLGWTPETTLEELVAEMVDADLERLKRHEHL